MAGTDEVSPITPSDRRGTQSIWKGSHQEKPTWGNANLAQHEQENISHEKAAMKREPISMPPPKSRDVPEEELAETLVERKELPPWRWRAMIVLVFILAMINGYDISNTANIQATIYEAMGHIEVFSWITLGYCAGLAAVIPLTRRFSEIFDIRAMMLASIVVFIVGVAVTGSASNIGAIIAGRALNGIGAGGVTHLKPAHVPLAQGMAGIALGLGLFIGPLIGSGFADNKHTTWRWAYYVMLPFLGVILPLSVFVFPSFTARSLTKSSVWTSLAEIDWVGAFLHAGTFTFLPVALTLSGSVFAWKSAGAILLWVFAGLFLITYVLQQAFCLFTTRANRILPGHLILNRTVGLANLGACCAALAYSVGLYYFPVFFSFARGHGPIGTAVRFLPFIGVFIVSILLSSVLLTAIRRYKILYMIAGPLILTSGALITTQMTPTVSEREIMGFEALLGLGVGLIWPHAMSISSVSLPAEEVFAAACLANLSILGMIALAVGLEGSIFQNEGMRELRHAVGGLGFSDRELREALAGVASPLFAQLDPAARAAVFDAVTSTIKTPFHLVVAAGTTCTLMSWAMRWEKLDMGKNKKEEESSIQSIERDSLDMGREV